MQAKTVKYRTDMPTWITNGRFLAGTTAVVEIVSYTEYTQTIPFIKGTNLFSSYVIPLNTNLTAVMKALCNQGAVSKILDENGKSFQYSTTTKSWVNNIGSLTNTEGYSITTNMSCNLIITGKLVGLPLDIPLKTTSNFISYPRMDVVNAMTVIQPLITQNKLVKVQDEKGLTIEKIKGVWRNNIGNFTPGKAYKVTVSAACILTIQKSYPKSAVISSQTERMDYFVPVYEGNGLNHMNNNLVGLTGSGFQIGDELAAFDGAACVGSVKLNTDNFIRDFACLIASSASSPENPDGFVEGHSIQLFSWSKATGTKSSMQTEINSGEMSYKKLASVELQLKSTATSIASIENSIHFDVFPNPAKDIITIRFSQIPEPGRTIEIIDLSGKKIVSRVIHEISEEFDVRDQPAGLYVVKSILGKSEMVQKIMLN